MNQAPVDGAPLTRVAHPVRFPAGTGAGQRHADRRDVVVTAHVRELGAEDDALPLELAEISATGAFVASDLLLPVGAAVELTFTIPGLGDSVRAEGRIVRVQHRGTQPGMGVLFERMTPDDRARLRTFTAWS